MKDTSNWVLERSSGYAGYRCTICFTWVYADRSRVCQCNKEDANNHTMKEEIEKAAQEHSDKIGHGSYYVAQDFTKGAEWILDKYQGISPSTVTEIIEALREKDNKYTEWLTNMKDNRAKEWDKAPDGEVYLLDQMIARTAETVRDLRAILSKADKELNQDTK